MVMETINVVVNDDEKTMYRRTNDDDDLLTKPSVAPELAVAMFLQLIQVLIVVVIALNQLKRK